MSEPRRWNLQDGGANWYIYGPKPQGEIAESIDVIEVSAHDKLAARLAEAEAVIEFYANKNNWLRDANGWRHDMIVKDLDDETLQDWDGRFSGRTARAYLEKYKERKP